MKQIHKKYAQELPFRTGAQESALSYNKNGALSTEQKIQRIRAEKWLGKLFAIFVIVSIVCAAFTAVDVAPTGHLGV